MYKIYKIDGQQKHELKKPEKNCWIDISNPTSEDISKLKSFIEITDEVLISVDDAEEVPKLEKLDDYNFLVLQTPVVVDPAKPSYRTMPLGILYNSDCLVTIYFGKNDVLDYLKLKQENLSRTRIVSTARRPQFILKLMLLTSKFYLTYLKQLTYGINRAQEKFQHDPNGRDIHSMMEFGKALSYFSGYLQANQMVYLKITKKPLFRANEEDIDLCEDLLDENQQALEAVKIHNKILHSTISTFANLISNKLNENVKYLTTISIILMMPTLVASVYGMNLVLPFQGHEQAFVIVMLMAVLLTLVLVIFFFRKKLF